MADHTERIQLLRGALEGKRYDGFVTAFTPHLRYLTGFTGSNGLCLITSSDVFFITDFRYKEQIEREVSCSRRYVTRGDLVERAAEANVLRGCKRVGVEKEHLSVDAWLSLRSNFPSVKFVPTEEIVESFAAVKSAGEIALIRQAVAITEAAFRKILRLIRPGISELDLSAEISYLHKKMGAEKDSFEPIVVSGPRGSLPHGRPSVKKIKFGEMVTIDMGCFKEGYCSDLTRTVAVGKATAEQRKVYRVVLEAQRIAIETVAEGVPAKALDAATRSHIRRRGFGKYFGHGLGHGIGLQIHEFPRVSTRSLHTLRAGNVITVEPGIYLPGKFGIRIEDDVVVQPFGGDILTETPRDLMVL